MTNLEKNALITLDNNANIQPKIDLDIVFSSADYDSGILNFQVLKNKRPLILGDPNVIGRIILKHNDNSVVVQKMEIDSKVNEFQFAYQVPNEILQRPGKVEAQITIAEKGNSNVVVAQRKFSFEIQNSLFSSVNAETKTTYIVEFQELQQQINNTVVDIQESIKNSQDYVTKIEEAKVLALSEISDKLQQSLTDFISTSDEKEKNITTKGDKYIQDITNGGEDVNKAIKDFKDFMIDKDIVLNSQSENWQKYKLTEEDGMRIRVSDIDPVELDTGYYQIWNTYNMPVTEDGSGSYWNVDVLVGASNTKQILAVLSENGKAYLKNIHEGFDNGWKKLISLPLDEEIETQNSAESRANETLTEANKQIQEAIINNTKDTGWIEFDLINGAKKNTEYADEEDNAFKCSYRIIDYGNETRKIVRLNGQNVTNHQIIANLPTGITENVQVHWLRTPLKYAGAMVVIRPDGSVDFQVIGDHRKEWIETDYFYGEITWSDYTKK